MFYMFVQTKDFFYKFLVEKDAENLKERLGSKEKIVSYLGGEKPEETRIPNRKSAYALLYETLVEILEDQDAKTLIENREFFIIKRRMDVLWTAFEYKEKLREKEKECAALNERKQKIEKRLEKTAKLKSSFTVMETNLNEELNLLNRLLSENEESKLEKEEVSIQKNEIVECESKQKDMALDIEKHRNDKEQENNLVLVNGEEKEKVEMIEKEILENEQIAREEKTYQEVLVKEEMEEMEEKIALVDKEQQELLEKEIAERELIAQEVKAHQELLEKKKEEEEIAQEEKARAIQAQEEQEQEKREELAKEQVTQEENSQQELSEQEAMEREAQEAMERQMIEPIDNEEENEDNESAEVDFQKLHNMIWEDEEERLA